MNSFSLDNSQFALKIADSSKDFSIEVSDLTERELALTRQFSVRDLSRTIGLNRDYEFLKWRLLDHPQNSYRCAKVSRGGEEVALVVFKSYGEEIDIVEIFVRDDKLDLRMEILSNVFCSLGVSSEKRANIWSNLHTDEHLLLEKLGFRERQFSTYFGFIPLLEEARVMPILDVRSWHYRFIDSDVY